MTMNRIILFIYQIKSLMILWICCWYQINLSLIISISKSLTDLCLIRLKIEIRNIFASVVYSVSVV